ncbi:MAG: bacterial regulatory helix-turn-helix, lysR family protein [Sphingomonas bacterium]|uniref:LysR substrate-binding domain-containing protein n=1 Tax=Sphingomonas bacterium TaxID=1895847 RepID=UPI0026096C55|nr:LysR substrate-binding domain-containing protein [Sphingomonas bacterium]MDB5708150.1 bacterial regulatory helix-turn-helix, lysR family protein [Sphingomonas bacterium]
MNLRQLRYFIVLAEELHFRRAAERLAITQAPLSVAIQTLEREIGALLFHRTQRRVELTEIGAAFRSHALAILERVDLSLNDVRDIVAGEAGQLRIGFTSASSLLSFFPNMICAFRQKYPKVQVTLRDMTSATQIAALQARELDIGIMRGKSDQQPADISYTRLIRDRLVVAMHVDNPLSKIDHLKIADLRDQPFLFYPPRSGIGIYDLLRELCAKRGFSPIIVQEVLDSAAIVCLAATGLGIAVVPSELQRINVENVLFKPLIDGDAVTDVWLVSRAGEPSPLIASFRHMVLASVKTWKLADPHNLVDVQGEDGMTGEPAEADGMVAPA